jgi:hypothetical protein
MPDRAEACTDAMCNNIDTKALLRRGYDCSKRRVRAAQQDDNQLRDLVAQEARCSGRCTNVSDMFILAGSEERAWPVAQLPLLLTADSHC